MNEKDQTIMKELIKQIDNNYTSMFNKFPNLQTATEMILELYDSALEDNGFKKDTLKLIKERCKIMEKHIKK